MIKQDEAAARICKVKYESDFAQRSMNLVVLLGGAVCERRKPRAAQLGFALAALLATGADAAGVGQELIDQTKDVCGQPWKDAVEERRGFRLA